MLKKSLMTVLLLGLTGLDQAMAAGGGSGTVGLQIELTPACAITSGNTTFAALDFGQVKTQWSSALSADTEAMVSLLCSDSVTGVSVQLDGGVRGDRTLAAVDCSGQCPTIPYRVFRDTARTIEYEMGVAQDFIIPITSLGDAVELKIPLHGSIAPGSAGAWGAYADTLVVTIDFN